MGVPVQALTSSGPVDAEAGRGGRLFPSCLPSSLGGYPGCSTSGTSSALTTMSFDFTTEQLSLSFWLLLPSSLPGNSLATLSTACLTPYQTGSWTPTAGCTPPTQWLRDTRALLGTILLIKGSDLMSMIRLDILITGFTSGSGSCLCYRLACFTSLVCSGSRPREES